MSASDKLLATITWGQLEMINSFTVELGELMISERLEERKTLKDQLCWMTVKNVL